MEYISLGSNCSITYQLSKLGLRKCAYPFDWTKITLNQLISILTEDFDGYSKSLKFVSISNIHPIKLEPGKNDLISSSSFILTNKYKIKFAHELEEKYQLDEFKNRLEQRIKRFRELVDKDVCFVRIELSQLNQSWYSNIIKLHNLLYKYSSTFKLILIICSQSEFQFPPNIKIYRFDNFSPDWKMDMLDWKSIFI